MLYPKDPWNVCARKVQMAKVSAKSLIVRKVVRSVGKSWLKFKMKSNEGTHEYFHVAQPISPTVTSDVVLIMNT